ncbi:MAG: helix-turn-helix domain-containing protein [Thermodesulfobacteriota bacterium]|nr:helix-turn-helix domain-containing protein [Thermodesulfobacteriota bacterium]
MPGSSYVEIVTPERLPEYFPGLKPKTLANLRSKGEGPPYYKRGRRIFYRLADVQAWITERQVKVK